MPSSYRTVRSTCAAVVLASALTAQRGDRAGEAQPALDLEAPPAPALTAAEEARTFTLPPGFRIELAAAEPLVVAPVAIAFAADAAVWVVEMRGFMPDVEGEHELAPTGTIAVLRDRDQDGQLDERVPFLTGLVLPRAVLPIRDGALVLAPPKLLWCRDTDGDGRADVKVEVAAGFDEGLSNPEHAANALTVGFDQWVTLGRHPLRFRAHEDHWQAAPDFARGQWGLASDDFGRWFYNYNSDGLRMDLWPGHYAARHPRLPAPAGVNSQVLGDQTVWPGRVTPGVNRGYREGQLRDGKLATFTAACGVAVYRDRWFGEAWAGKVFVCEPAGNLVRCCAVREHDGIVTASNALGTREFLTSTDERFRPVHVACGPDGALWITDMYRGLIQHKNFVTTFLRKQVEARGLEQPLDRGRLWRVVPEASPARVGPRLDLLSDAALVEQLDDANGWVRDTAQRLLVERQARAVAPELATLVRDATDPRARIHALWTLAALGGPDAEVLRRGLADSDAWVRVHALRVLEQRADASDMAWADVWRAAAEDPAAPVRWQAALTLGSLAQARAGRWLRDLVARHADDPVLRGAAASGLADRELEQLQAMAAEPGWQQPGAGRTAFVKLLASLVVEHGDPQRISALLALGPASPAWQQGAVLDGMLPNPPRPIAVAEPPAWRGHADDPVVRAKQDRLLALLRWPGREGVADGPRPLTADEQVRFAAGQTLYAVTCMACHQPHGDGLAGLAPPLRRSPWVTGSPERLIRITLQGMHGPVEVLGQRFDAHMPGWPHLDDAQTAAVLTYVRRAWGQSAEPISAAQVQATRSATRERLTPWTAAELDDVK